MPQEQNLHKEYIEEIQENPFLRNAIHGSLKMLLELCEGSEDAVNCFAALEIIAANTEIVVDCHGGQEYLDTHTTLENPETAFHAIRRAIGHGKVREYEQITEPWKLADYYLVTREAIKYYTTQGSSA